MVEDIEELRPELQPNAFSERKLALDRKIGLRSAKTSQKVSRLVTGYPGCRGKRRRIDPSAARRCLIIEIKRNTGNYVRQCKDLLTVGKKGLRKIIDNIQGQS